MTPLYFILGQTATGKTAYATRLAKELGGELVNCDSRQVYRYLNIVTGKSDNPVDVPIHMVDIVSPEARYTAYEYAKEAYGAIEKIIGEGAIPIVVGGTGLYAYTLLHYSPSESAQGIPAPDTYTSVTLEGLASMEKSALQQLLSKINSDIFASMNKSDQENPRRLINKILNLARGGKEIIRRDAPDTIANRYAPSVRLFLHADVEQLVQKIDLRVRTRLKDGAVNEAQKIRAMGYAVNAPGLRTIGYPTLYKYIDHDIGENTLISEWTIKEKQYAKRQKTYLLKYFPGAEINYV